MTDRSLPSLAKRYLFQDVCLFPSQLEFATSESRIALLKGGRASGKTIAVAHAIAYNLVFKNNHKTFLLAYNRDCISSIFYLVQDILSSGSFSCLIKKDIGLNHNIYMNNGSFLITSGFKSQGKHVKIPDSIIIDECEMLDSKVLLGAILPVLNVSSSTTLHATGTPGTQFNFVNALTSMCKLHNVNIIKA